MFKNKDTLEYIGDSPGKYISLKEASEISDYAPDYIGQLIRSGKIEGKQVYSTVAWVTTEASLRQYMETKGKKLESVGFWHERASDLLRYFLYGVITLSIACLVVLLYVSALYIDRKVSNAYSAEALRVQQ